MLRCLPLLSTSAVPVHRTPGTSGATQTEPRPSPPAVAVAHATAGSSPPARERTGLPDPRESGGPPAIGAEPPWDSPLSEIAEGRLVASIGLHGFPPEGATDVSGPADGAGGRRWIRLASASSTRACNVPTALVTDHPRPPLPRRIGARSPRLAATSGPLSPLTREPSGTTRVGRSGPTRNSSAAPAPGTAHLAPPSAARRREPPTRRPIRNQRKKSGTSTLSLFIDQPRSAPAAGERPLPRLSPGREDGSRHRRGDAHGPPSAALPRVDPAPGVRRAGAGLPLQSLPRDLRAELREQLDRGGGLPLLDRPRHGRDLRERGEMDPGRRPAARPPLPVGDLQPAHLHAPREPRRPPAARPGPESPRPHGPARPDAPGSLGLPPGGRRARRRRAEPLRRLHRERRRAGHAPLTSRAPCPSRGRPL